MAFLLLAVLAIGVIWATASVGRAAAQQMERQRGRSIDQDLVERRLYRIEEAIDAMSQQIQRLTDQQGALLGRGAEPTRPDDRRGPERTE